MPKLSIIVPGYNCAGTLEEAVDSIYAQRVSIPFDVTMVDDGSTDATYAVMQTLSARYQNIRLVRHERNLGGGATRNTAVDHSDGEIIFCLDSDDVLGAELLERITQYWIEKMCDGVGVSRSIKFNDRDINSIGYISNFDYVGKQVPFESFIRDDANCSLNSVFLITRDALSRCGGYPTDHGFDTQGLAFRFLANGLSAYVCPGTVYYHRINYHESYYLREANAGRINRNWFLVFDEFLYLFSDLVKRQLLEHDLSESNPILEIIRNRNDVYAQNYEKLVRLGRAVAIASFRDVDDKYLQYCVGSSDLSSGNYQKALYHFSRALGLGLDYPTIYCKVLDASLKLSGKSSDVVQLLRVLEAYSVPISAKTAVPISAKTRRFQSARKRIAGTMWLGPVARAYIRLRNHLHQRSALRL